LVSARPLRNLHVNEQAALGRRGGYPTITGIRDCSRSVTPTEDSDGPAGASFGRVCNRSQGHKPRPAADTVDGRRNRSGALVGIREHRGGEVRGDISGSDDEEPLARLAAAHA
jgi:hypothetical protein